MGAFVCFFPSSSGLWLAVGGQLEPRDAALDNYVRLVINNFFAALDEGIPALGIPIMDPLNIGNLTIPTLTYDLYGNQILDITLTLTPLLSPRVPLKITGYM